MHTSDYYRLLTDFLAQTGLPVRQGGRTTATHARPCLIYTVPRPAFGSDAALEAQAFFPGMDALAQRNTFLAALEQLIPPEGALLHVSDGAVWITRDASRFITTDADTGPALRVHIRANVRLYG